MSENDDFKGVVPCLDYEGHKPECAHGPTLVFQRFSESNSSGRKFFACAACRDRKLCSFFHWVDKPIPEGREEIWKQEYKAVSPKYSHTEYMARFKKCKDMKKEKRKFCVECCEILLKGEDTEHEGHEIKEKMTNDALDRPTELLPALQNPKANAQYLFAPKTAKFVVELLKKHGYKNAICIGTPRIHERIQLIRKRAGKLEHDDAMNSILLDLDYRFSQFFSDEQYCEYNMFNHHFFSDVGAALYKSALRREKTVILVDPPFGGICDVLMHNLNIINKEWRKINKCKGELPTFIFYPYFFEKKMKSVAKSFTMCDYKVNYSNHREFSEGSGNHKLSPIRMFTNTDVSKIALPGKDGYKYCKPCERFVAPENQHCYDCDSCTSKNGLTYKHCTECDRCVKPSYHHCQNCNKCLLKKHDCAIEKVKTLKPGICTECERKHPSDKPCNSRIMKRKLYLTEQAQRKAKMMRSS